MAEVLREMWGELKAARPSPSFARMDKAEPYPTDAQGGALCDGGDEAGGAGEADMADVAETGLG